MKGRIIGSQYGVYKVMSNDNVFSLTARGLFRHKNRKLVVGDLVEFDDKELVINDVEVQKSFLIRPCIANIDQVAIVMSAVEPLYSSLLVDKFLTYVYSNNLKPIVIITKIDKVIDKSSIDRQRDILEKYGCKVLYFSKVSNKGLEEIDSLFQNKITALMGQTGVGKSSLLNALVPSYQRLIGEYSEALGRGKHQTKEVVLLPYRKGFIADTPGFSSLEIELTPEEVASNFPLIKDYFGKCYFKDCLHLSEKHCVVQDEIGERISEQSYENYKILVNEAKERKVKY